MKPRIAHQKTAALTVMEVLVCIAVLLVLASLAIAISNSRQRHDWRRELSCEINLRQVGVEFRSWEGGYDDKYPMQVSVTNGGAMELVATGNLVAVFQVMSNELSTLLVAFRSVTYCYVNTLRRYSLGDFITSGLT